MKISKKQLSYLYIFLIIIAIILLITFVILKVKKNNSNEPFENQSYSPELDDLKDKSILLSNPKDYIETIHIKETLNTGSIPSNLFMCWKTKNLPPEMNKLVNKIKEENPEFNIYIFDDNDCRNMIEKYFIKEVVDAFDTLIPGAYKADLWRYCVLYVYGGIYMDIKYVPINGFKFKELTDKEYFVRDRVEGGKGIFNALMVCKKNNLILEKGIKRIIYNIKTNFYGNTCLDPTGPIMLKNFFSEKEIDNLEMKLIGVHSDPNDMTIVKNDREVLKMYAEYRNEQKKMLTNNNTKSYGFLWSEGNIYKKK